MISKIKDFYLRYRPLTLSVVVGVVSLAILIVVIIPQMLRYFENQKEILSFYERLEFLEAQSQALEKIDEIAASENLEYTLTILPTERDIPKSMAVLQNLIRQVGLYLRHSSYAPQGSNEGSGIGSFQFNLSVSGEIGAVRNFLLALQEAPQVFQVGSIRAKFQREGGGVEAEIPVVVYYAPLKEGGTKELEIPHLSGNEEELLSKVIQSVSASRLQTQIASSSAEVPLGKLNPFE